MKAKIILLYIIIFISFGCTTITESVEQQSALNATTGGNVTTMENATTVGPGGKTTIFPGVPIYKRNKSLSIPDDFDVILSSSAFHAEWGSESYHIHGNGTVVYHFKRDFCEEDTISFVLPDEELLLIYQSIVENDFFELEKEYANPEVRDGGVAILKITANNRTHEVMNVNADVPNFDHIATTIIAMPTTWRHLQKADFGRKCRQLID